MRICKMPTDLELMLWALTNGWKVYRHLWGWQWVFDEGTDLCKKYAIHTDHPPHYDALPILNGSILEAIVNQRAIFGIYDRVER